MSLKFRSITTIVLILFSVLKSNSQIVMNRCDHLIFIENIPNSKEVIRKNISIKSKTFGSSSPKLNKVRFMKALNNKPKALKCSDEVLFNWHYSPWADITFLTSEGKYEVELYLGGLGIMTLPNGKKGTLLFDFSKNETP